MEITTATAAEMQNDFGKYLDLVMSGQEVIITKNGLEVGRLIPKDAEVSSLTDSLTGILRECTDPNVVKEEELNAKYKMDDEQENEPPGLL